MPNKPSEKSVRFYGADYLPVRTASNWFTRCFRAEDCGRIDRG